MQTWVSFPSEEKSGSGDNLPSSSTTLLETSRSLDNGSGCALQLLLQAKLDDIYDHIAQKPSMFNNR